MKKEELFNYIKENYIIVEEFKDIIIFKYKDEVQKLYIFELKAFINGREFKLLQPEKEIKKLIQRAVSRSISIKKSKTFTIYEKTKDIFKDANIEFYFSQGFLIFYLQDIEIKFNYSGKFSIPIQKTVLNEEENENVLEKIKLIKETLKPYFDNQLQQVKSLAPLP